MLTLEGVTKVYRRDGREVRALDGVSLRSKPGELLMVQGPSGCGKTTLLLVAGGLLRPDTGTVTLGDRDLYGLDAEGRARLRADRVGFVFQRFHLVPYLSVLDNVRVPSLASGLPDAETRARQLIGEVGLTERAGHVPAELSTGERQRTALARALLNRPDVLLADEPTGNLDDASAAAVLDHLAAFAAGGGTVLLVTHDARAADRAGRVLRMDAGRIVAG